MVVDLLGLDIENRLAPGREVVVREASTSRGVISLECGGGEVVFSCSVARVGIRLGQRLASPLRIRIAVGSRR